MKIGEEREATAMWATLGRGTAHANIVVEHGNYTRLGELPRVGPGGFFKSWLGVK